MRRIVGSQNVAWIAGRGSLDLLLPPTRSDRPPGPIPSPLGLGFRRPSVLLQPRPATFRGVPVASRPLLRWRHAPSDACTRGRGGRREGLCEEAAPLRGGDAPRRRQQ